MRAYSGTRPERIGPCTRGAVTPVAGWRHCWPVYPRRDHRLRLRGCLANPGQKVDWWHTAARMRHNERFFTMRRPGFVLTVDQRTPRLRVQAGSMVRMERFPEGSRVVYPPDPQPRIRDVDAAIAAQLSAPTGR